MAYERILKEHGSFSIPLGQESSDEFKILSQASDYEPSVGEGAYRSVLLHGTTAGDNFLLLEIGSQISLQPSVSFGLLLEESLYMADQIEISFPKTVVNEDSSFTATLTYRDATTGSSTPTTVHYRVDCLSSGQTVTEWTQIATPDTSNTITITSAMNDIKTNTRRERKQLVVQTDRGLSTQVTAAKNWIVKNLQGIA